MSIDLNKSVFRRFVELQTRDLDAAMGLFAPGATMEYTGGGGPTDPVTALTFARSFFESFPGGRNEIETVFGEGDYVACRGAYHGTHRAPFQGIAATGKEVVMPWIAITRVVDGKIVDHRVQMDIMSLLQQIGAMPAPA